MDDTANIRMPVQVLPYIVASVEEEEQTQPFVLNDVHLIFVQHNLRLLLAASIY